MTNSTQENLEQIIVLRKRLKKFIKKVEQTSDSRYEMASYSDCVFSKTIGSISTSRLAEYLHLRSISSLSMFGYKEGLTPLQAKVVGLFTSVHGDILTKEEWLVKAKKVSKKLKKYIKANTPIEEVQDTYDLG